MEKTEIKSFKSMTDEEIAKAVIFALSGIRDSYYKYGEIIVTVSGGYVKHIDVRRPLEEINVK